MTKSMMLVTSSWGTKKTFKMIPVSVDAAYNEAIYDVDSKVLAVIGRQKKESMHMVAKLNEWGDPVVMKIGKRNNGKEYAEERKTLETFYEYYIENQEEIVDFIKMVAVNADTFDYTTYTKQTAEAPTGSLLTI
jgi:hypothetical protein